MKITKSNSGAKNSNWNDFIEQIEKEKNYSDISAYIAFQVISVLRKQGIKQIQLAELLNVTPQQISKILSGKENLTIGTVTRLKNALNIEIDTSISGLNNFLNPPVEFVDAIENPNSYFSITLKHDKNKAIEQYVAEAKPLIENCISGNPLPITQEYILQEVFDNEYLLTENYN